MKKILIIAICLFGLSPFLKAQMLNLNYQISLPMNQVKDFTDKASFRGFDIEYHQFLGDQFSIGAAIGWDVFYKDKKHTPGNFRFNGNSNLYTITGNQYRYRRLEVGQFASTISRWQFALAPEVGMYIPINDQFAFNVGARYNYGTKAAHGRVPEIQTFSFNFGVILMGMD